MAARATFLALERARLGATVDRRSWEKIKTCRRKQAGSPCGGGNNRATVSAGRVPHPQVLETCFQIGAMTVSLASQNAQ
jgi:hypothetical protein